MTDPHRDPALLHRWIVEEGRTLGEVAEECGVSESTISRWLRGHEIEREVCYRDCGWLYHQYVETERTQTAIAEECNVSAATISHWLSKTGVAHGGAMETRECATCGDTVRYYPALREGRVCSNACANEHRETRTPTTCPSCEQVFDRESSMVTTYCCLGCWAAAEHGGARSTGHRYGRTWQRQRAAALARDEYRCVECGMTDQEHTARTGRSLEVHHRVPVRLFDQWELPIEDAHELANLSTRCRTHHLDAPGTVESLTTN